MAAPTIINLPPANLQPRFQGFPQQNPLEAIMRGSREQKRDDNQMLALLLSILQQQQQFKQRADESEKEFSLRRERFDEEKRATGVSEGQTDLQLGELLAGQKSNREFQEQLGRQADIDRLTGRAKEKLASSRNRDLGRLKLSSDQAQRDSAEGLTRGTNAVQFVVNPIKRALSAIQDTDDPTNVQFDKLNKALGKGVESITSVLTGVLAEDGLTQSELLGATGDLIGTLNELASYVHNIDDDRIRGKFDRAMSLRQGLLAVVDRLETPETVFGDELDALKTSGFDADEAFQVALNKADEMRESGASSEDVGLFLQQELDSLGDLFGTQDSFNPPFDLEDPAMKSLLGALSGFAEETPASTGSLLGVPIEDLSPAAQDVFSGRTEQEESFRESGEERERRMRTLGDKLNAQSSLGLRGFFSGLPTRAAIAKERIGGGASAILNAIGGIGASPGNLRKFEDDEPLLDPNNLDLIQLLLDIPKKQPDAPTSDPDLSALLLEIRRQEELRGLNVGALNFGGF